MYQEYFAVDAVLNMSLFKQSTWHAKLIKRKTCKSKVRIFDLMNVAMPWIFNGWAWAYYCYFSRSKNRLLMNGNVERWVYANNCFDWKSHRLTSSDGHQFSLVCYVDGVANEQCLYVLEQGMEPAFGQLHKALLPSQVIAISLWQEEQMTRVLGDSEHQVSKTNSYTQWSQLYVYCLP
jgi:hypothetical protein